jgi:hypothetical protein
VRWHSILHSRFLPSGRKELFQILIFRWCNQMCPRTTSTRVVPSSGTGILYYCILSSSLFSILNGKTASREFSLL